MVSADGWRARPSPRSDEEAPIPTNIAGFLMLVVLALPGYVYHRALGRHVPARVHTAFQELVSILFVSVIVDVLVVGALETGSRFGLWYSPSFKALFDRPGDYVTAHFTAVCVWGAVALAVACATAYGAGAGRWWKVLPPSGRQRWNDRVRRLEPQNSAWWLLFREHPDAEVYIGCVLEDGSYLAGVLHSYSRVPLEHGDRELTLRGDISYRPPGETETTVLPQVNAVAVSARRLAFLTVTYLPAAPDPDPSGDSVPSAGSQPPADPQPSPDPLASPGSPSGDPQPSADPAPGDPLPPAGPAPGDPQPSADPAQSGGGAPTADPAHSAPGPGQPPAGPAPAAPVTPAPAPTTSGPPAVGPGPSGSPAAVPGPALPATGQGAG
ncbi:DUF6338 family protein [Streptomyces sp. NPDC004609]|uniref:DUF6338 family protein n=1 Tax=Streptomyces sp. NPDC004609 TaxID=3364704 RepID=UPI00369DFB90